jgi:anti-sigma factor RsiW
MSVQTSQCETFRPELVAFLDGELAADQAHAVRQHLKSCGDCRIAGEGLSKTWDLLGTMPQPKLHGSLVGSIMAQVAREPAIAGASQSPAWSGRSRTTSLFVRLSAAAAMLIAALLVRGQFGNDDGPAAITDAVPAQAAVQVAPPAVADVVPHQMHDIDTLRAKFMPREVRFTHESDTPDPLLDVVADRGGEARVRMENGVIMMEKPMMDLNNN